MDDHVFELTGGKAVARVPIAEVVAVVVGREHLEKPRRPWFEGRFPGTRATGSHGAHGGTVITVVTTDELELSRSTCLSVVLAGELQGRLHRL